MNELLLSQTEPVAELPPGLYDVDGSRFGIDDNGVDLSRRNVIRCGLGIVENYCFNSRIMQAFGNSVEQLSVAGNDYSLKISSSRIAHRPLVRG